MLSKLAILSILVLTVYGKPKGGQGGQGGQGGRGGQGGPGGHGGPPPPPFLQNVTDDARKSYFDIVSNPNLTLTEIDTQSAAWASTNGVSDIYTAFQANITAFRTELQQNLTTAIGNLPTVQTKLSAIFENKDQTRAQVGAAIDALRQTNPIEVGMLLSVGHGGQGGPGGPGGPGGRGGPGGSSHGSRSKKSKNSTSE